MLQAHPFRGVVVGLEQERAVDARVQHLRVAAGGEVDQTSGRQVLARPIAQQPEQCRIRVADGAVIEQRGRIAAVLDEAPQQVVDGRRGARRRRACVDGAQTRDAVLDEPFETAVGEVADQPLGTGRHQVEQRDRITALRGIDDQHRRVHVAVPIGGRDVGGGDRATEAHQQKIEGMLGKQPGKPVGAR
jgi:hypothetical protein